MQLPVLPKQLDGKFVKGQMYKYQDSLPKLPVPSLEQTLRKYVRGVQVRSGWGRSEVQTACNKFVSSYDGITTSAMYLYVVSLKCSYWIGAWRFSEKHVLEN